MKNDGTPQPSSPPPPFRLGEWLVQPSLNRVSRGSETIRLEPIVMQLLCRLASRPGEVFSREELLGTVWGDTIVCEDSLTRAVSDLRRIFRDDAQHPRYIETIRKGGYRLIAPVSPPDAAPVRAPASEAARGRRSRWPVSLFALIMIAAVLLLLRDRLQKPEREAVALRSVPLTTYEGREMYPAVSKDGTRIAFAWDSGSGKDFDIYTRGMESGTPLRLTDHPDDEICPAWSPNGSRIAFIRLGREGGVFTVPSPGGMARRLSDAKTWEYGLDWSPNGEWLAFSSYTEPESTFGIVLLSTETLELKRLTFPPPPFSRDLYPRFAPDGESIAFVRTDNPLTSELRVVPVSGGSDRSLGDDLGGIVGFDWTAKGGHLLLAASRSGEPELWRFDPRDRSAHWIPTTSPRVAHPDIAQAPGILVYEEPSVRTDIYRARRRDDAEREPDLAPWISSTRRDFDPSCSPGGERIAFVSDRSGFHEIWIADSSGGDPKRVTELRSAAVRRPRWSPDGGRLAFSSVVERFFAVHVLDVATGEIERVSTGEEHELVSFWSPDGEWIHFEAGAGCEQRHRKTRPAGRNTQDVMPAGVCSLRPSPDGTRLYYIKTKDGCIWSRPATGGAENLVVRGDYRFDVPDVIPTEDGIYLLERGPNEHRFLFHAFASSRSETLFALPLSFGPGVCMSPDGETFLFEHTTREGDLALVRAFP